MFETWYKMLAMLQSGLDIRKVITHRLAADDFQQGFETMARGESGKEYALQSQTSLDSNTVDMDVERGQIADNAIRYQLALQAYEDEYKEFRQASMTGGTR